MQEFSSADRQLAYLAQVADITWVNPVNGAEEREQFFSHIRKGKSYNPHYQYIHPQQDLAEANAILSSLSFERTSLGQIFSDLVAETSRRIRLIEAVGHDHFSDRSIEVYGSPSERLIQKATRILRLLPQDPETDTQRLSAQDLAEMLMREIEKYNTKWTIEISDRASAKVNVIPSLEKIEVKKGEEFSEAEAQRLIVHEINAHLLRAVNGSMQPFKIFATGLADSERTDEGLATIVEEMTGMIRNRTFRLYAGRVMAAYLSQTNSFYDVFSELCNAFSEKEAFYITQRVKRGLSDTSRPGGLIKDYIYLDGREQVKRYLQDDGDIEVLYCGNTSVRDAHIIKELMSEGIVKPPKYLPWFLKRNAKIDNITSLLTFEG